MGCSWHFETNAKVDAGELELLLLQFYYVLLLITKFYNLFFFSGYGCEASECRRGRCFLPSECEVVCVSRYTSLHSTIDLWASTMASSSSILPRSRQSNSPALEQADQEGFPFHQSPNSVRPASVTSPKCTSFTSSTRSARDRTRFSPSSSPSRQESSTMFGTMTGEQLRQHHQQDHAQFAVKREA